MANNSQYPGPQPLRPPLVGPVDPNRQFVPTINNQQFRPMLTAPLSQQFVPVGSQHFQHHGQGVPMMNVGLAPQTQQQQISQPGPHLPPRFGEPGHGTLPLQLIPPPVGHPNRQFSSDFPLPQQNTQSATTYMPSSGVSGISNGSSYNFGSYGQPHNYSLSPSQPPSQMMHASNISSGGHSKLASDNSGGATGATMLHTGEQPFPMAPVASVRSDNSGGATVTPMLRTGEQPFPMVPVAPGIGVQPAHSGLSSTEWREHISADGRRYYYNKKTKVSSWEKPSELMTPIERADASTNWKEFTSPEGRKYYYNKITKESKWIIPEELKLAREQLEKASSNGRQPEICLPNQVSASPLKIPATADVSPSLTQRVVTSPVSEAPIVAAEDEIPERFTPTSASPIITSVAETNKDAIQMPVHDVTSDSTISETDTAAGTTVAMINTTVEKIVDFKNPSAQADDNAADGFHLHVIEEIKKEMTEDKVNDIVLEEKPVDQDTSVYADKLEAKNAFKALLESANIGSDWTWDRAMRIIINDKRYGALKSLGERKQTFNEFLGQRKKHEVDERRVKQKKAREEFKMMLEESTELTSSMRWSKAERIFENDERFRAVERDRDRRDLYETFLEELKNKERGKAQEERKRNIMEYRNFLESCDFIKASSQWRKVQERLEADDRCSCLEKIDRLEIFQEYLHELEKEEEEQRRIHKEELRKSERRNRDEFRKLMEEHVAEGIITPKTHWRDYCMKVKDVPTYLAVASNTSGSTPKDLFEDVAEELQKQYQEDRTRVKDAVKLGKIQLTLTWTLEDFKAAISKDISTPPVSDVNISLVFEEFLERVKEKEEKVAKKRKRLEDDFFQMLCSIKEISASSKWEDCKLLLEGSQEWSCIGEDNVCKDVFEEYVAQLREQEKENERKWNDEKAKKEKEREERERRKDRKRKDKDGGRGKEKDYYKKDDIDTREADVSSDIYSSKDYKKEWKRHHSFVDYSSEDEIGNDHSKKSHPRTDRKKSRRHASGHESDSESRRRRHKREHRNSSPHGNEEREELEDGEFGDDGDSK